MNKWIVALCLGALACSTASPAQAQYSRPATPIEALFGALLGAPVGARRAPPRVHRQIRPVRQGYVRDWGFTPNRAYRPQPQRNLRGRVERRQLPAWRAPAWQTNSPRAANTLPRTTIDPRFLRQTVAYRGDHAPGTIVIDTTERFLYFVQEDGTALRYGIGVGREGFEWNGTANVERKAEWPAWHPPAEMRKREPWLPVRMEGGAENPLGARAMYLFQGNKDTLYRIHGTNKPNTIGQAVSSGCIRMLNDDVADLYNRVPLGTTVVVI